MIGNMPQDPEAAAKELLTTVWAPGWSDLPYPVNPAKIAESLGLKVYTVGLDQDVSGMLVKRAGRDPEIYLNASDSKNRQRFTCAHELGHYVKRTLSGDVSPSEDWESIDLRNQLSASGTDPEEVWANKFGAALLMPRALVEKLHRELAVPALAYEFGVSSDAMSLRLQNLGLQ
jgi:Zn-dependent peptidase ImmA (M78 family)